MKSQSVAAVTLLCHVPSKPQNVSWATGNISWRICDVKQAGRQNEEEEAPRTSSADVHAPARNRDV